MSVFSKEYQHKFIRVAEKLKKGTPVQESEEALIAEIMSQHPEFIPIWELGDLSASPQEINGEIVNPFVHTALHLVMEKQIEINKPEEVVEVVNTFLKNGIDRHKVIHQVGGIYAEIYFSSLRRGQMFEEFSYIEIIKEMAKGE
ncbi:MAG: DUF1841 family protein [Nitrospirae bacterium]|nr:DUF1841 family protein [Nitrospirota bacterium]MBI3595279.1 DUF1841 family protein [Nitrospirota bacterium]